MKEEDKEKIYKKIDELNNKGYHLAGQVHEVLDKLRTFIENEV